LSHLYEYQDLIYGKIKPKSNSGKITAVWSNGYFVCPSVVTKHKHKNEFLLIFHGCETRYMTSGKACILSASDRENIKKRQRRNISRMKK
jgi:hypothetical protein